MARPENKYQLERDERQKMGGIWFTDSRIEAFEQGVDAGRKWGREETDEEWRGKIRQTLEEYEEGFKTGYFINCEHIEALL